MQFDDDHFVKDLAALDEAIRRVSQSRVDDEQYMSIVETSEGLADVARILELLNGGQVAAIKNLPFPGSHDSSSRRFGRFIVSSKLGEGTFGEVFLAYDPHLGRDVALKVAKWREGDAEQRVKRFLREAKIAASLRHPAIVPLYEFGQDNGALFLTFALIPGKTLHAEIADRRKGGDHDPRWCAAIVARIADGLAFAHAQGIVHRDVKPSNIMLDATGDPMVTDFGLASIADGPEGAEGLTHSGMVLGTPLYLSPEQASGRPEFTTGASDQYSLGVILYQMLTGHPPFSGRPDHVALQHMNALPPRPSQVARQIPIDLETICLKCLEKSPARRYPSCSDLANDLRAWLAGEPVRARQRSAWEKVRSWVAKRPAVSVLLGLLFATFLTAGIVVTNYVRKLGELNQDLVETARRAEAEKKKAIAEGIRNARFDYASTIRGGQIGLESRRHLTTLDLLKYARNRIAPVEPGFEWHELMRRATDSGRRFEYAAGTATAAVFSPDGRLLASSGIGSPPDVVVWDAATGEIQKVLKGHFQQVFMMDFSPDGKLLACMDLGGELAIWDHVKGEKIVQTKHPGRGRCAVFHPTRPIILGTWDRDVRILSIDDLKIVHQFRHDHDTEAAAFSPDGTLLASGSQFDPVITLRDVDTWEVVRRCQYKTPFCSSVSFSQDGKYLVSTHADDHIHVWKVATGTLHMTKSDRGAEFRGARLSPDGKKLYAHGVRLPDIALFDLENDRFLSAFVESRYKTPMLRQFGLTRDGLKLAIPAGEDGSVLITDTREGFRPTIETKVAPGIVFSLAYTPDGQQVLTGSAGLGVHLWDTASGRKLRTYGPLIGENHDVVISPDGKTVAAAGGSILGIRFWDFESGRLKFTASGHTDRIFKILYTPDGGKIISASWDNTLRIWDATTGAELHQFKFDDSKIEALALHPSGEILAVSNKNERFRFIDVKTAKVLSNTHLPTPIGLRDLRYTPDGTMLIAAQFDKELYLLSPKDGTVLEHVRTRAGTSIAVSPDGHALAAGSKQGEFMILDIVSRTPMLLASGLAPLRGIRYSPSGRGLAAVTESGDLYLWGK